MLRSFTNALHVLFPPLFFSVNDQTKHRSQIFKSVSQNSFIYYFHLNGLKRTCAILLPSHLDFPKIFETILQSQLILYFYLSDASTSSHLYIENQKGKGLLLHTIMYTFAIMVPVTFFLFFASSEV